ncbi:MAG TPA: Na/Pi cotransporter family protein [Smithella sp.]|nr:MAG: Na+/Pi-cotransporter [Deltaproteobacteria bacterium ADurb.Bin022]HPC09059.1 Na/Pi cotransporter family protein [Smithella sp.]HQP41840.1 Na/Pi cotransporter family protein [Smithella sp.]
MAIKDIFVIVSGVILFLIGMVNLSSSIRKLIDVRIKKFIKYAVGRPISGLLTGIVSTIAFQSSSASTVLTIGLVSAGLISFSNSLAIILGADIGTTLTVQLVIWRFTDISPLIISLGGLLWLIGRNKWETIGEIIFYFGLMFFGLDLVNKAVEPLKQSPLLIELFTKTQNPLIGIGMGIAVTGIVQASAIPISIMVLLAQQDIVSLENAVAVVMGANIGTTITALLAGTVATRSGKRTAFSHLIFKSTGIGLCFMAMPSFVWILQHISSSVAQQIALAHFLLNLFIVVIFIFLLSPFAAMMTRFFPGKDDILPVWPEYLDVQDITNPQKALDNVHKELKRQTNMVRDMYLKSMRMINDYSPSDDKSLFYIAMVVKNIREQIVGYLWKLSVQDLSEYYSKNVFAYTAMTSDIESIGNHVLCISKLTAQKTGKNIKFSDCGEVELHEIIDLVSDNFNDAFSVIDKPLDKTIMDVIAREEQVDIKVKEARDNHLERFHKRLCDPEAGPIFVELLLHLERISDLCNNIAEYMLDVKED